MTTELLNDLKNAEQLQSPPMPNRLFDVVDDGNWVYAKNGTYLKFKYAFESFVAACLLVVLWPVILVLWIAVKITSPRYGILHPISRRPRR